MGCCISSYASNFSSYGKSLNDIIPDCEKCKEGCNIPTSVENLEEYCLNELNLQTGDVLLFHCTHAFGTYVQVVTGLPWDHVAMIVKLQEKDVATLKALMEKTPLPDKFAGEDIPDEKNVKIEWTEPKAGQLMVFESMGVGSFAYPLQDLVVFRGKLWKYMTVRRLRDKDDNPLNQESHDAIMDFVKEAWAVPYEKSDFAGTMELICPVIKGSPKMRAKDKAGENLDNIFCSELVTEALQRANILPEETLNSNEILPHMYSPGLIIDKYIEKENIYKLGKLELLIAPQTSLSENISSIRTRSVDET